MPGRGRGRVARGHAWPREKGMKEGVGAIGTYAGEMSKWKMVEESP